MEIKILWFTNKNYLLYFLFFLFVLFPICAEETVPTPVDTTTELSQGENETLPKSNYFARETEGGIIEVVQTLTWPHVEYIKFYEVVLEERSDKGKNASTSSSSVASNSAEEIVSNESKWQPLSSHKTTDNFIELKLFSGQYRYQITLYNLLSKPVFTSEWREFTVKKANIPYLDDISPKLIYLDDINDGLFKLEGYNLLPDSVFTLNRLLSTIKSKSVELGADGLSAQVAFPVEQFNTGDWRVTVTNPGGFSAEIPLHIQYIKWYDLNTQLGYMPSFVLYDNTIKDYFETNAMLLGLDAKVAFFPIKRRYGYFGISFDLMYHHMENSSTGYDISMNVFQAYMPLVYRFPVIKNKFLFDAFAGPGLFAVQGLVFSFPHDLQSEPLFSFYLAAEAGMAFKLFVYNRLYLELGVNYTAAFIPDMSFITIMPSLSVGWQF